jgi:branched-chain amino acid transport system substrate-binding protein
MALTVEDTKRDPAIALEKLKTLAEQKVKIVIGPQTSAELKAVKQFADDNDILLISHSSTAPSLALKDNIFRFVTDDKQQGKAIAQHIWDDGVRIIVPMWRKDVYGNELYTSMKDNFEKLGGTVVDGVRYSPPVGKFAASLNRINFIIWDQDLKSLSSQVDQAISDDSKKVGVYIIAMDEIVPILIQAQNHEVLDNVKWYGSDSSAQNERLVSNIDAAKFAENTSFLSTVLGLDEANSKLKDLEAKLKKHSASYDANAYDAFWVAALTENVTGGTDNIAHLKGNLTQIANSFLGATGNTSLNEEGDREYGTYDYWMVSEKNNSTDYHWKKVGK